jgi:hypothetical protein
MSENKSVNLLYLLSYVFFSVIAAFIVSGNLLIASGVVLIEVFFMLLYLKSDKEEKKRMTSKKMTLIFLGGFFSGIGEGETPKVSFENSVKCLGGKFSELSFEEAKNDLSVFSSLPLNDFSESFEKAMSGKKGLMLEEIQEEINSQEESIGFQNKNEKKQIAALLEAGLYLAIFLVIKIIFHKNLIDYSNPVFQILFGLFCVSPLILIVLEIMNRRKKNENKR